MDGNLLIDNIRMLCKKNKVSISKLESDLFLSPGLISRWNKSMPSMDKIMDIAEYFGVSIDELVGRSKKNLDHSDIGRLLIKLYNRSLTAESNWEIFNFEDPPTNLSKITSSLFSKSEPSDCYFTNYMNGYFFFTITHTSLADLQLALFILPDVYSKPECVCSDVNRLKQIYDYLNVRFAKQLNRIKTVNFINTFIKEPTTTVALTDEKITPMRIEGASNF